MTLIDGFPSDNQDDKDRRVAWAAAAAQAVLSRAMRPRPPAAPQSPASALPSIPGYRLERRLGQGRMSMAYLADDLECGGKVVLKVMQARHAAGQVGTPCFLNEFAIPAAIRHEHVIRMVDHGCNEDLAYIAMEYLEGGDLSQRMRAGMAPAEAMSLLRQAALALAAVHGNGAVHRDVKPANLLLRASGSLVLADFGVAWRGDLTSAAPLPGQLIGTPRYVAPEQAQGAAASAAADVYSLGVVLYEMLCGSTPFPGTTMMEVLSQHVMAPVPRLPVALGRYQALIDAMLEKRPARRLADGAAVLERIDSEQAAAALEGAAEAVLQPPEDISSPPKAGSKQVSNRAQK